MAYHALTAHFNYFFKRLNPSQTFVSQASSHYNSITSLIEDPNGPSGVLSPKCFLQGSYKQDTAIYTINDIDIVTMCELWYPGSGSGRSWGRDEIFATIAAPLLNDRRYRDKVHFHGGSMCIKVDLGIKVEILPVVYKTGNSDPASEPFCLYRPEKRAWEDGYARYHQAWLSWKNYKDRADNNFIPAIKLFKHLRSKFSLVAVSFHIECLLFSIPDYLFRGGPADYIPAILNFIASNTASDWYGKVLNTPCGDRDIFVQNEWRMENWERFHEIINLCNKCGQLANKSIDRDMAIETWQLLLGNDFFPTRVNS